MKRTNLVLDEEKLEEARRILGLRTYSATVNKALEEVIRLHEIMKIRDFFGSGIWEGDLEEMRADRTERLRRERRR